MLSFFKVKFYKKHYQRVKRLGWVQTVCKSYQQMTLMAASNDTTAWETEVGEESRSLGLQLYEKMPIVITSAFTFFFLTDSGLIITSNL